MENRLTKAEFNQIKLNTIDDLVSKLNKDSFNICVNDLSKPNLSEMEIKCIKNYSKLKAMSVLRTYKYFEYKLIK